MAQVKKHEIRQAILDSAFRLFSDKGYQNTTLAHIAADAGVSTANVYVYFSSKMEVLFAIYDPWLRKRIAELEMAATRHSIPRKRLGLLLRTLWQDLPSEHNGFAHNLIQAITSSTSADGYRPTLLLWMEGRIASLISDSLPEARRRIVPPRHLAHMLMMAFDGFVINHHLNPKAACTDSMIAAMLNQMLGSPDRRRKSGPRPR